MTGDISEIKSIWPVLALAVVLGVPAFFSWLNSRAAREHARRGADEIEHQSQPNSGNSMRDSLDRIEATVDAVKLEQAAQGERIGHLEAANATHHPETKEESHGAKPAAGPH